MRGEESQQLWLSDVSGQIADENFQRGTR
jgi:hypothetical protein